MKKRTRAALASILFGDVQAEVRNAQIASFIPTERNIQKLIIGIEPVQDLHGYSYPWPADGGKNLLDPDELTLSGDSLVWGYYSSGFLFKANTTYTLSVSADLVISSISIYAIDHFTQLAYASPGNYVSFTPTVDTYGCPRFYMNDIDLDAVKASAQIEIGSTATSFVPFENICPITGWSAADIFREASYDPTASPYVTVSFGQTVYAGRLDVVRGVLPVTMGIVDLGSALWDYVPSGQGRFISSAISATAKAPLNNDYQANILCDSYKAITANDVYNGLVGVGLNTSPQIWFHDGIHTIADLNAGIAPWLNGVHLLYELAIPTEITLTPTQIATIQRQVNYVWADCGPIIELIS